MTYKKRLQGEPLSTRELQVISLAADGNSNNEIGEALGINGLTIKSHLYRATRKAEARDRAHLVLIALRAGLVVWDDLHLFHRPNNTPPPPGLPPVDPAVEPPAAVVWSASRPRWMRVREGRQPVPSLLLDRRAS